MSARLSASYGSFPYRVRRALDIAIALAALVILTPALVVVALAIIAESPGPLLFSQVRLGRNGRPFRLYKFRKFHHEPTCGGYDVTLWDDPRMTRVGRLLERTKLDELPQLWNVLVGEMSIVGPRPESLAFADCFAGSFRGILDHTPGLLGPNQVYFRNESKVFPPDRDPHEFYRTVLFPLKARNDLAYFSHRSLRSDILWIFRGGLAVFGVFLVMEYGFETTPNEAASKESHAPAPDAAALEQG
jgi:lipopolysaccharide/colanic/teichoic acid biosynthesis glycosyltransferase